MQVSLCKHMRVVDVFSQWVELFFVMSSLRHQFQSFCFFLDPRSARVCVAYQFWNPQGGFSLKWLSLIFFGPDVAFSVAFPFRCVGFNGLIFSSTIYRQSRPKGNLLDAEEPWNWRPRRGGESLNILVDQVAHLMNRCSRWGFHRQCKYNLIR